MATKPVTSKSKQARTVPQIDPAHKPQQLPPYNVVLLNDEDHTYEYVIQLLRTVFAYSEEKGFQLAKCVDEQQRAIVFTTHKELAELKREQIQSHGTDPRVASCKGSMSAIIEPA
jgi:ATP-dependent Clp protease adaptor protein ClpS